MPLDDKSEDRSKKAGEHVGITIDEATCRAWHGDRLLVLTEAEFRLLAFLVQHAGHAITRPELVDVLTDGEAVIGERTVDVHIAHLRQKLGQPQLIETVRLFGYRLRADT